MPKLRVMNARGDEVLEWKRGVDEVEVNREFDRLVSEGHLAYRVESPGVGTAIAGFDPEAEEIVLHGPLVGG